MLSLSARTVVSQSLDQVIGTSCWPPRSGAWRSPSTTPPPDAEERVRVGLEEILPGLGGSGSFPRGPPTGCFETELAAPSPTPTSSRTGPERLDPASRSDDYRAVRPDHRLLATSTSGRATDIAQAMRHPERLVVWPPFNPPHLLAPGGRAGRADSAETLQRPRLRTLAARRPQARKEVPGFVANRLQAALFRGVHLVVEGPSPRVSWTRSSPPPSACDRRAVAARSEPSTRGAWRTAPVPPHLAPPWKGLRQQLQPSPTQHRPSKLLIRQGPGSLRDRSVDALAAERRPRPDRCAEGPRRVPHGRRLTVEGRSSGTCCC